jgi:hypothetical protein
MSAAPETGAPHIEHARGRSVGAVIGAERYVPG